MLSRTTCVSYTSTEKIDDWRISVQSSNLTLRSNACSLSNETTIVALLIITPLSCGPFSFSLIGEYLAGSVDSYFSSVLMRVGLAALVFLPFSAHARPVAAHDRALYAGGRDAARHHAPAGFPRLSLSDGLGISSLFTVFTPLYITLIYDLLPADVSCAGAIC